MHRKQMYELLPYHIKQVIYTVYKISSVTHRQSHLLSEISTWMSERKYSLGSFLLFICCALILKLLKTSSYFAISLRLR